MKPNFALSLSHDGILLLHRAAKGWRRLGHADPSSDTLAEELAVLRRTATALDPGGVRCKIIIPNEQIRYLTLDDPATDETARRAAAADALERETPYSRDDLAFDIYAEGTRLHVAAVARETLAEAEAFAEDHRFHPVSFVAIPSDTDFAAEPFFGETKAAQELLGPNVHVVRDKAPLVILADVPDATPETPDKDTPVVVPDPVDDVGPSFVSRRTVPTFRSDPPDPAVLKGFADTPRDERPGFAEPPTGFEHRRSTTSRPQNPRKPARKADKNTTRQTAGKDEADRMTVFGQRSGAQNPSRLGSLAVMVAICLALFAGVTAFTSGALGPGIAGLFDRFTSAQPETQFSAPLQDQSQEPPTAEGDPDIDIAALDRPLSDEDAAVLDALRDPTEANPEAQDAPEVPSAPTPEDVRASYAVTGIWPLAPDVPNPPPLIDLEDLYVTSIDPINPNFDAVALPAPDTQASDLAFVAPAAPAPAGTDFELDDRGLVVATPQGSLNPDGVMVFEGPPPVRQPDNLLRVDEPGENLAQRLALASYRPQARPGDLIETTERATLSGLTRSELGELRPQLRPQSAQENALAAASLVPLDDSNASRALLSRQDEAAFDGATARAVVASLRPDARPNNFSDTVAQIQRNNAAAASTTQVVATASVAPRVVAPQIPSSASTTREATVKNAINLRRVNLIGVYGTPSSRRALVRMGNGRYRKVEVGDRIDGGRVSAIGDSELRYQKSGRAIVLKMPRG